MVIVILTVCSHSIATHQVNNQCRAPHAFAQPQICFLVFHFSVMSVLFVLGGQVPSETTNTGFIELFRSHALKEIKTIDIFMEYDF